MHNESSIDYEVSRISRDYERIREEDEKYYMEIIEENESEIKRLRARIEVLESGDDLAKKCGELSEELSITKDENARLMEEVKKYRDLSEERGKTLGMFISGKKADSKEIQELRARLSRELKEFFDNRIDSIEDDIKRLEYGELEVLEDKNKIDTRSSNKEEDSLLDLEDELYTKCLFTVDSLSM